jgi:hypothetical protein
MHGIYCETLFYYHEVDDQDVIQWPSIYTSITLL